MAELSNPTGTRIDVTVTYDPTADPPFRYEGGEGVVTGPDGGVAFVLPQGQNLVVFNLRQGPSIGAASFLSRPFQFIEPVGGYHIPRRVPPPGVFVQRNGDKVSTLTVTNTWPDERKFTFYLCILADGQVIGDDPVLINQPPGG